MDTVGTSFARTIADGSAEADNGGLVRRLACCGNRIVNGSKIAKMASVGF